MRFEPGFVSDLKKDFNSVDPIHKNKLKRNDLLDEEKLLKLVSSVDSKLSIFEGEHAEDKDVVSYEKLASWQSAVDAIKSGHVAFVVLAGGAGTRAGGPKAFMKIPKVGISLASIKLMQSSVLTPSGELIKIPTWFMSSPEILEQFSDHLNSIIPTPECVVFEQFESYRLQIDNRIDFLSDGIPNFHPTGHGDLGPALVESGVLEEYPNVKYCIVVNCDNVLASPDLFILSNHIESNRSVTCEIINRQKDDKGGTLAWVDGILQVVENFRLPDDFVENSKYHNTNSMIINVDALKKPINWKWHRVRKSTNQKLVVQYERLLQQYTEEYETNYILVPREKRHLPIKSESDLDVAGKLLNGNNLLKL